MTWRVERQRGPASEHLDQLEAQGRTVRVIEVTRPALVLGSTQPAGDVDEAAAARAGVEVVRRRSGGGAVLLTPGETLWFDVAIPAGDPLWSPDVGRAFHWLGRAWAEALGGLGLVASWHDGPMQHTPWSKRVCFAGLGPGEVLVDGRKVVGMSQRRTRGGALFQCCALLRWDPGGLLRLLALTPEEQETAAALEDAALGVGPSREGELRAAILDALAGS